MSALFDFVLFKDRTYSENFQAILYTEVEERRYYLEFGSSTFQIFKIVS